MPTFKNMKQLNKVIQPYLIKAMEMTRDEITRIIQKHVDEYYEENFFTKNSPKNEPYQYERTYKFKNALSESVYPVEYQNGKFSFRVGFSDEYLDFVYDGGATGFEILSYASEGSHGGVYGNSTRSFTGTPTNDRYGDGNVFFWNDALIEIEKTYGSIENLFITNCYKVGLRINKK